MIRTLEGSDVKIFLISTVVIDTRPFRRRCPDGQECLSS